MMYLVDTCVISEMIKPIPNAAVVKWFSEAQDENVYLSSITIGEIAQGFESLQPSRRRRVYEDWFHECVELAYEGRILPFDNEAARRWAHLTSVAAAGGHPRPAIDSMVAAIASVHNMTVVTRNIQHMSHMGVPLLNPFED